MNKLREKLIAALEKDRTIVSDLESVGKHPGNSEDYLGTLGLERKDLKRLERYGFAVRGYTPNTFEVPARDKDGNKVLDESGNEVKNKYFANGSKVRWVLLAKPD